MPLSHKKQEKLRAFDLPLEVTCSSDTNKNGKSKLKLLTLRKNVTYSNSHLPLPRPELVSTFGKFNVLKFSGLHPNDKDNSRNIQSF